MASGPSPARSAAIAVHDSGIPVLVLREPGPEASGGTMQVLVPRARVADTSRVLEGLGWRYTWERGRLSALAPMRQWWWDGGSQLEACWSCPAGPLAPHALSALTSALWQDAAPRADGLLVPGPTALAVHLAVQSCRPGRGRDADWDALRRLAPSIPDAGAVAGLARRAGVGPGVRRALDAARAGLPRPGIGPVYQGWRGPAWWLASFVQARARPPRLRRLLAGTPALGDATIRIRVAGADVLAGPGVFVPTPDADLFVELALDRLAGRDRPVVVEVGTGCGAIALAISVARPDAEVHGTDLFDSAVAWARRNARRVGAAARFHRGSLLEPVPAGLRGRVDVMLANLPFYPPQGYAPIGSVPRGTIQGSGDSGLDLVRRLALDAMSFLRPDGLLVLQMFAWQWETFQGELEALGYRPGTARLTGPFAICPVALPAGPGAGAA